jgi:hypothetical protein
MATTTNYSWTTPDDTDLVKDGAAAIRTLGSSADTTVKDLNPGTTAGDIDYYTSSTAKARIAIGTAGQILQVNAGATAPEWAAPAGGGKVLQVIQATYATQVTNTTSTFEDTGLTATITPSAATSNILVLVSQYSEKSSENSQNAIDLNLLRGATQVYINEFLLYTNSAVQSVALQSFNYLDSPNTTSATTYKTQFKNGANVSRVRVQAGAQTSTMILMEIGA